jgi:hypothetical protein
MPGRTLHQTPYHATMAKPMFLSPFSLLGSLQQFTKRLPGPTPYRVHEFQSHPNSPTTPSSLMSVHRLLAATHHPAIRYDLVNHPSLIVTSASRSRLSSQSLSEAAVKPELNSMIIVCTHFRWQLAIRAASNGFYVTVFDVLDGLHHFLYTNVARGEYEALRPDIQRRVSLAFQSRCSRLPSHRERQEERMKGLKRIDFLMGSTQFQGLAPTAAATNVWQLNVA